VLLLYQSTLVHSSDSTGDSPPATTIVDVLLQQKRFQTLVDHLNRTQLIPYVNDLTSTTLFAPDDKAFEKYDGQEIDKHILLYHFITQGMRSQDFFHGQLLTSNYVRHNLLGPDNNRKHNGQRLKVTLKDHDSKGHGTVYINQAQVTTQDIQVNNDTYIQVLDQVLVPPPMLGMSILLTLLRYVSKPPPFSLM
jgi:uncharacterized surface protein with fasciclin (FAS1) repeats